MSTKRRRQSQRQPTRQRAQDSYMNSFTRLGAGQMNLMNAAEYPITRLTQNFALLNSMYRNDWIAGRIIDTIPQDMTKNWYKLVTQLDPEKIKDYETLERRTRLRESILEGLKWGRLFGGAAGIIVIDGQEDMLDQPLNLSMVMPGSFKGLIIADRWSGVYPEIGLVQDFSDPDFGLPEYYTFSMSETDMANGIRVHHSRVVRFTGRPLPYIERMSENYWGLSEIEHVYAELNKRNTTSENIANLVFQANIRTYKMQDLGEMIMATDPRSQRDMYQTLLMQNFLTNSMGINVMDREDDLVTTQYTFSGISDVYELFMLDIAGACEIPVTKLFGRSPAGMNATGESDLTNYYNKVSQEQEAQLRPIIDKLMPVMALSAWGMIPDDIDYAFEPVGDTSEQERANLIQQSSAAIVSVFNAGLISQKTALRELRQSGLSLNMWTNIDDAEVDAADDTAGAGMDEMGMGMPAEGATPETGSENPIPDPAHLTNDGKEGWFTLSNGKKVFFGENGEITKGPKELIGKTVSEMSNGTEHTTMGNTVLPDRTQNMPTVMLDKKEYGRLMHRLNSDLSDEERASPIVRRVLGNYMYHCENHGFDQYRCILRERLAPEIVDCYNEERGR